MSTKKDALKQGKNAGLLDYATVRHGLKLSDVRYESTTKLQRNPQNVLLFRQETPEYFTRLREDVQQRGILVPLIAKLDGTLLAGHNRLQVAEELGLREVPVQYLLETLSPEDEKSFVVKDNLLRRQFTYEQWAAIFRELVPDYEERLFEESRGRKSKQTSISDVKKQKNGQVSELPKRESLAQEIAKKTSLNERTIRRINEASRGKIQVYGVKDETVSKSKNSRSSGGNNDKAIPKKEVQENIAQAKRLLREIDILLNDIPPNKRSGIVTALRKTIHKHEIQ